MFYSYGEEHRFWPTDNPDKKEPDFYDEHDNDDYFYNNEVDNEIWKNSEVMLFRHTLLQLSSLNLD